VNNNSYAKQESTRDEHATSPGGIVLRVRAGGRAAATHPTQGGEAPGTGPLFI